jgi:hypothetical protein
MHRKLSKDGLAVVSVCVDDVKKDPKLKASVETFLKKQQATFTNVILDEPFEVREQKLRFISQPCLYVFGRDGRWTQFKSEESDIDYKAVDQLVLELLKK